MRGNSLIDGTRNLTRDALFDGNLTVFQEKEGYRFSVDAVLLAGLTRIRPVDRIVELGTGCGVVALVLAHRRKTKHKIFGIEIQAELAGLARRNVEENALTARIEICEMDFRDASRRFAPESFDLILSNPPYRKTGSGRINPNRQKAIARHELASTLPDLFSAAWRLLPQGGRIALIYPAARIGHLLCCANAGGFSPKRLRIIYSRPGGPGRLVHLECSKGGGEEATIEPPFYIYREDGEFSDTMLELYKE
ncbi:MAG: tRNA1(Val) (adenine(37)-N6)-methyltransferase [Syntrophobacter sp.]